MAHPNEDLLRRGYAAFSTGDLNTVFGLFADDMVWHNGGDNQLTGDFRGHEEIMGFFGKLMDVTGGTFRLDIHDVLANDAHGTVLLTAHAERDGQPMSVREVNIWHLADGKTTEFWSFPEDSVAIDRMFA
jgi:ketosteroid isomerase-like protein